MKGAHSGIVISPARGYNPGMEIFTVYWNPSDFPGKYVVRRFVGEKPDPQPLAVGTLEEVRGVIPAWMTCLARNPGDDPCILETWL